MKLIFYRVTPHSVLFFRDPRPFSAGEQALARLQFPPRLTPFLGALRTKYLQEKACKEQKEIDEVFDEKEVKQISVFWFSLMKDGTPLIPAPCDLLTNWKALDENRFVTEKVKVNGKHENPKVPLLNPHKAESLENARYLTPQGIAKYQNGQLPSKGEYFSLNDLWEFENRVGVGLSPESKTAERSKFYRITVARPKKGVSFLVGVEFGDNIEMPPIFEKPFTTRLGGEGHIAVWEKKDIEAESLDKAPRFREIIALTHVPIKSSKEGEKYEFEIQNWCINKLDSIGGWDYKEHRPKPLVKALKPGTVLRTKKINPTDKIKFFELEFDSVTLSIAQDLSLFSPKSEKRKDENNEKHYLAKFSPDLKEPNTIFLIKLF